MVAVAQRQDLVAAPVVGGQQEGGVVGLGPGGGEEHLGVFDATEAGNLLRQGNHRLDEVQRGGVEHAPGLRPDGVDHLGHVVAGHRREDPAEEVQVAAALTVPDPAALAAGQLDGLLVVQAEPVRHDPTVAGEQLVGHGHTSCVSGPQRRQPATSES